jgi:hypothetical protein
MTSFGTCITSHSRQTQLGKNPLNLRPVRNYPTVDFRFPIRWCIKPPQVIISKKFVNLSCVRKIGSGKKFVNLNCCIKLEIGKNPVNLNYCIIYYVKYFVNLNCCKFSSLINSFTLVFWIKLDRRAFLHDFLYIISSILYMCIHSRFYPKHQSKTID